MKTREHLIRAAIIPAIFSLVLWVACAANSPPVIRTLKAAKIAVPPGESLPVEAAATDADGDTLTFSWSASGGSFSGSGLQVTWQAPTTQGDYTITLKVSDGKVEVSSALPVGVWHNRAPSISKLTAFPRFVDRAMTSSLECQAEDPDGDSLTYQWKTNAGNVTGEGAKVKWVAPNAYGDYTVTVTVSDGKGGSSDNTTGITVACPVCPN